MRRFRLSFNLVILLALICLLACPSGALASRTQITIFEDTPHLMFNPAGTFARMRLLGVDMVRVIVSWNRLTPGTRSRHMPHGFHPSNPAAYAAAKWAPYDGIVRAAQTAGVAVNFDLTGDAPLWATGRGNPHHAHLEWDPSDSQYGAFVHAAGVRYGGNYDPHTKSVSPGNSDDLPAVTSWSLWNEPDYGPALAPQGVPGNVKVENSPRLYRGLLDAGWTALHHTGHGGDTILFGELAPRGKPQWGIFAGMKPGIFVRALYCVDSRYRPLRGSAAAIRGCPTTSRASSRFHAQHPALFNATGFADHPYTRWYPPNVEAQPDPDYSSLPLVSHLERALDRSLRVYHSHRQLPIYNTEYGYITSPPKHDTATQHFVPQQTAAYYLNWAEYLSWRNPRLVSFDQYLLYDPLPARASTSFGGFASGLLSFKGRPKPTYYAFRLPLYLPVTSTHPGHSLEVWGCIRSAKYAIFDTSLPQTAQLQFEPSSGSQFTTIMPIAVTSRSNCYFDVHVTLPSSGTLRLTYTYPATDPLLPAGYTIFSRHVRVTLR